MLTSFQDFELWVESLGQGYPVLVMHGGLGLDHTYLRPHIDALSSTHNLVYYDHRGNGQSSRVSNWEDITHATWVEDAERLRTRLGFDKLVLFGHSYGGLIAQEYALAYPDRVAALILCATTPAFDYAQTAIANVKAKCSDELFPVVIEALSRPCPDDLALSNVWRTILPLYFHRPDLWLHQDLLSRTQFSAAASNHGLFRCVPEFDVTAKVGNLRMPVLILGGRHDWITPPAEGAERLHALIPESDLVIFEQSGHFPFIEEHDAFIRIVEGWLAGLSE